MFARNNESRPVALIDLGDTLCDCNRAINEKFGDLNESTRDEPLTFSPETLERRRRLVMETPGFWRTLPKNVLGFELLGLLRESGFELQILSKGPREVPQVWADKVYWCRTNVPDLPVTITDDKSQVFGNVLVDDWYPYVLRWQQRWPDGLGILPAHPWNGDIDLSPRCLRFDGSNTRAVADAIRLCRERYGSQDSEGDAATAAARFGVG
jgi:5'-nucleotidase